MYIRFSGKGLSCYHCAHQIFLRVHRSWWMKLIPGSRLYRCDKCNEECLVLVGSDHIESVKKGVNSSG